MTTLYDMPVKITQIDQAHGYNGKIKIHTDHRYDFLISERLAHEVHVGDVIQISVHGGTS